MTWGVSSESENNQRRKLFHGNKDQRQKNNFRSTADFVASFYENFSSKIGQTLKILLSEPAESRKKEREERRKRGREEEGPLTV